MGMPGLRSLPMLTSSGGHGSGWYASYWNPFLCSLLCGWGGGGIVIMESV